MKKLSFLCTMLLAAFWSGAQNNPINFEPGGYGASWTWRVFENASNPALQIVANPNPSGINTSATVARFEALQAGNPWAGCESAAGPNDLGPFVLNSSNAIVKIMVYKSVISDVGIKLATATGFGFAEIRRPNTLINQWEELTFDLSAIANPPAPEGLFSQFIIFPDFNARTQNNIIFFDNITFNPIPAPTVAAPAPTRNASQVISIFSDSYTNVAGTNFNPNWGQQTVVTQTAIQGNNTLRYQNLNYQGIDIGSPQNLSSMDSLHLNVWSSTATALQFFLISPGPVETPVSITVPTVGWSSVRIPLSAFAPVNLANVIQLKFVGNNEVFIDNIFFFFTPPTAPVTAAPTPTRNPANVISIFSDAYTNVSGTNFNPNWGQQTIVTQTPIQGNNTLRYQNLNYQGIQLTPNINVSTMDSIHLDFWSSSSTNLRIFLISPGPVETPFSLTVPTSGWSSISIPLSAFAPVNMANVFQFKFEGNGEFFMDNLYFFKTGVATAPVIAAPTPNRNPFYVASIYSDTYTNLGGTIINPNIGQQTISTQIQITGNNTMRFEQLDSLHINLASTQNFSSKEFLHVDIWSTASTVLNITMESTGGVVNSVPIAVPTSGWLSLDIPLTSFSPVDLASVVRFKFDGDGTFFMDNLYLHETPPTAPLTAAPTPIHPALGVISIYSDAYTNVAGSNLNPNWGQATIATQVQIQGNNTMKYSNLNYQGLQIGSNQNVLGMDSLHVNIWSVSSTTLRVFLISPGIERSIVVPVPTNGWSTITVPLTTFLPVNLSNVFQFKFEGNGEFFMDNLYFFIGNIPTQPATAAPTPTLNPMFVNSIYSDVYTNLSGTNFNPSNGQNTVASQIQIAGNNTYKYEQLDFQSIVMPASQNFSANDFLHVDVWSTTSTSLSISLISAGPVETSFALNVPAVGWGSYNIALSAFAPVNLADIVEIKFTGNGDFFMDNLYFFQTPPTAPTIAAPMPLHNASEVISVFSDSYTNLPGTNFNPFWAQATVVTQVPIQGNNTLRYGNLNYQGTQFAPNANVSDMDFLHIDCWSTNTAGLSFFYISNNPLVEVAVPLTGSSYGWNSIDIPLSSFSPAIFANLFQFKVEGTGTLFLDNIYFFKTRQTPANNNFDDAIALTPGWSRNGTTRRAGASSANMPSCRSLTNIRDVWYRFNTGLNTSATIELLKTNTGNLNVALYNAQNTQNAQVCTLNVDNFSQMVNGLNQNTNYFIRVWSDRENPANFTIAVQVNGIAAPASLRAADCGKMNFSIGGAPSDNNQMRVDPTGNSEDQFFFQIRDVSDVNILGTARANGRNTRVEFADLSSVVSYGNTYNVRVVRGDRFTIPNFSNAPVCQIGFIQEPTVVNIPLTQLLATSCNSLNFTLDPLAISNQTSSQNVNNFNAMQVVGATGYDFQVMDQMNNVLGVISTNAIGRVFVSNHTNIFQYGQTYQISVRAIVGTTAGDWGAACTIGFIQDPSIVAPQPTALRNCNMLNVEASTVLQRINVLGANRFIFNFYTDAAATNLYASATVRSGNQLLVGDIVPGLMPNTTYYVTVTAFVGGIATPAGNVCSITTIGLAPRIGSSNLNGVFGINAYPNPFTSNSTVLVSSNNDAPVLLNIYDISGRLVRSSVIAVNQNVEIGNDLSAGHYVLEAIQNGGERVTFKLL